MLEIRHLQMLSALSRHGSLALTADEMNLTASAISHQLERVESYYDITLVNRQNSPCQLYPAGERVLELADSILM